MKRKASAVWEGGLKDGWGSLSTESRVMVGAAYGFAARFEHAPGTNPEELIAAAHAACFTMALAGQLGLVGLAPDRIDTTATVTMEKDGDGFVIADVHLVVAAKVPAASADDFLAAATAAKSGCPVSKVLKARITMDARLVP